MAHYHYDFDGENWTKVTFQDQCLYEFMWGDRCQREVGHGGLCWAFGSDGSLYHTSDDPNIAEIDTPPGHKDWISPLDLREDHYLHNCPRENITDPELIERLNRGEIYDDESITRPLEPVNWAEIYENGECPDCCEKIPDHYVEGMSCQNCEHVFYKDSEDDEI